MTGTDWTVVIGALFLGLTQIYSMYLDHEREKAKVERDRVTAEKVEEVRVEAVTTKVAITNSQEKLEKIAAEVTEVHHATNSMKDQLVLKTEQEALARGGKEEKDRADLEKKGGKEEKERADLEKRKG